MILKESGFNFEFNTDGCESCQGRCCTGESGYIWVNSKEIEAIASFLKLDIDEFKKFYLNKVNYKFSIKERELDIDNFACLFFENNSCSIYEVRPAQCRTFPFWDYFKENINEVLKECPATKLS
jgi:hypothetical protein